jgi:hypothetical protein
MSTYLEFMQALSDLVVPGVLKAYGLTDAPLALNALPAQWAEIPGMGDVVGETEPACTGQTSNVKYWRGRVVVVLIPVAQGLTGTNFLAAITMVDTLAAALDGIAGELGIGPASYTVTIRPDLVVADIRYWAVTADVSVLGA